MQLDHDADTGLRRAELVQALTDPHHGLPLELCGHRELTPGRSLGLVLLRSPDGTAALQLRYDRLEGPARDHFGYPGRDHAETFAAIGRRISKVTGQGALPPMPGRCGTG